MVAPDHTLTERLADVQGCPAWVPGRSPLDMACACGRNHGIDPFEARWAAMALGPRVACVGPVDRNENGYDFTMNR